MDRNVIDAASSLFFDYDLNVETKRQCTDKTSQGVGEIIKARSHNIHQRLPKYKDKTGAGLFLNALETSGEKVDFIA
jgi:hypothetical protein